MRNLIGCCCFTLLLQLQVSEVSAADAARVRDGLLVLYTFDAGRGDTVIDRSGHRDALGLHIDRPASVQWIDGGLRVRSSTAIRSAGPAKRVTDAIRRSNALSIEAWIKPARDNQSGPARIVSLSADPNQRNFTLGQDGNRYDVRLRTTKTGANGIPSTATPGKRVKTSLTHVVYSRSKDGTARIFIDGREAVTKKVAGETKNWDAKHRLSLANEVSGDRPWLGDLFLVAIYDRALSGNDVRRNFQAGVRGRTNPQVAKPKAARHPAIVAGTPSPRVSDGLSVLYTFEAGGGNTVKDRSQSGTPVDLKIDNPSAVRWGDHSLIVNSKTKLQSKGSAHALAEQLKRSGLITIETWVTPKNTAQKGPARIISLSADSGQRNFTLGQEGNRYQIRLRTSSTSTNGIPDTDAGSGTASSKLTHIVYTRDGSGNVRVYLNGKQSSTKQIAGNFSNWKTDYPLILANEGTSDRPWLGELHLVAIYHRALRPEDVAQNFRAGPRSGVDPHAAERLAARVADRSFAMHVAPLLARNCLECHDSATKKGGLDLSHKRTAFAGGESGKVIVPGKADESLLWGHVESGEMPPQGQSLSAEDKRLIRQWINGGAVWSVDMLDPAVYATGAGATEVWVQRLTIPEYIETVRSSVGVDIAKDAREV